MQLAEEQALEGFQVEALAHHAELYGCHLLRTFADDDDMCAVLARDLFAQAAGRQQAIVGDEAVVVCEKNVESGLDVAVLIGVVKDYYR